MDPRKTLALLVSAMGLAIAPLIWLWLDWRRWAAETAGDGFQMQYPMEKIPFPIWVYVVAAAAVAIWLYVAKERASGTAGPEGGPLSALVPTLRVLTAFIVIPTFLLVLSGLVQAITGGRFFR